MQKVNFFQKEYPQYFEKLKVFLRLESKSPTEAPAEKNNEVGVMVLSISEWRFVISDTSSVESTSQALNWVQKFEKVKERRQTELHTISCIKLIF